MAKFKLIAISPETPFPNEVSKIIEILSADFDYYHVRKPNYDKNQLKDLIQEIPLELRPRITLHSHYELIPEFNLGGLHLPEYTRKNFTPDFQIENLRISTAIHEMSAPELINNKPYDYIFISPVFNSISKTNYSPKFSLNDFKEFNLKSKLPLIALGGVTPQSFAQLKDLNFSGAALLGSLFS